jgi:hypothetical protein
MITVGFDFGTHQTKICYETVESGTVFYDVFKFKGADGKSNFTLPSFIRRYSDDTLRYGYDALDDIRGSRAITYFKQVMFSWTCSEEKRIAAEQWSVLYLAFLIFKLDEKFKSSSYIIQMGMPTDANPEHYNFTKRQAVKVMAAAMILARKVFKGNLEAYLAVPHRELVEMVKKCMAVIPENVDEVRKNFPIFVFPEAYASLIPLIKDRKLPTVGPNLFVDIGGGTVDVSFFTNQIEVGQSHPCLYYYFSIPYGLNMITEQNVEMSHNVMIGKKEITQRRIDQFRAQLVSAVDKMMNALRRKYNEMDRGLVMPFVNLCAQILDGRPICYSGGGSIFQELQLPIKSNRNGIGYNFSSVTSVSKLIDHSKLYVNNEMFHVLATAFALSKRSLGNDATTEERDGIKLVSLDRLFGGIHNPIGVGQIEFTSRGRRRWSW